jgi:hypothetical protein
VSVTCHDCTDLVPFTLRSVLADPWAPIVAGPATCLSCRVIVNCEAKVAPERNQKPPVVRRIRVAGVAK